MSERITKRYQRLFEVWMLHHYWLDEGSVIFDLIPDRGKKDRRLRSYDMRPFLAVKPTISTENILGSLGCLFRETATGFIVSIPSEATLPLDTVFNFMIKVIDSRAFDYTALTLRPRKTYDFYYEPEKTVYRYKENVPYLSNLTGSTREMPAGNKLLFLSMEIPDPASNDQIESIVLSGSALEQLISDDHSIPPQQLDSEAANLPVFLHQGDVPDIVPPAGLSGVPTQGIRLTDGIADDVFALVSLSAVSPDEAFSFIDTNGNTKVTHPVYQIRFKNRSTFWSYLDKETGAVKSTESNPLPLTNYGNAGTRQKPSYGLVKAERSGDSNKITRLVSEIYV